MPKFLAIHEIVYTDAKGKRAVATPGSHFALDDEKQIAVLDRAGAVRLVAEPVTATLAGVQDHDGSTRALAELTKAELIEIARGMEIEVTSSMTKADLVEAIEAEEVVI